MPIRRTPSTAPDLNPQIVAVLLHGFGAQLPSAIDPGPLTGEPGWGALYDDPAALWRTHERFLRATAAAWGWTPVFIGADGVARFWGEHAGLYGDDRG